MTRPAAPLLRRLLACLALGAPLWAGPATAQVFSPGAGFWTLPTFAWPRSTEDGESRWNGSYARLSTGFEAGSSRHFGSYAGPTLGFEGGRLWRDGNLVYGISAGVDALIPAGGFAPPGYGRFSYSRDVAGGVQAKVGTLLTPNVLLYGKVGGSAIHETWRAGPSPITPGFSRDSIAVRPDARVGVEWTLTDRMSIAVEAGVVGNRIR